MKLERRDVNEEYIKFISKNMRVDDQIECQLSASLEPEDAVRASLEMSEESGVLYDTEFDEPVIIFGLCAGGVIWALGTEGIKRKKLAFIKISRRILDEWNEIYPKLFNCVYSENTVHINWLKHSGCDILEAIELGPFNATFYRFERIANNV